MDTGVRFPTEREKLLQEAALLAGTAPGERLQMALELYALCETLLLASPQRSRQLELLEAREAEERQAWIDLMARDGQG